MIVIHCTAIAVRSIRRVFRCVVYVETVEEGNAKEDDGVLVLTARDFHSNVSLDFPRCARSVRKTPECSTPHKTAPPLCIVLQQIFSLHLSHSPVIP